MSQPSEAFEDLVARTDPAMLVVTAASNDERDGCLVGFSTQASIDPQQFVVWLSKKNRTYRVAQHASALVVHVVRDDQFELARRFGGETADEVDKLEGVDWHEGPDGAPVVDGCDWFAGRVLDRIDVGGDHEGFVLSPFGGEVLRDDAASLRLHRAQQIDPGHPA